MDIAIHKDGDTTTVEITGRLNTNTAPDLQRELDALVADSACLVLDFAKLDYISSAGLRVLLKAQKDAKAHQSTLIIRGVQPQVLEVFQMTGFDDFLTIE